MEHDSIYSQMPSTLKEVTVEEQSAVELIASGDFVFSRAYCAFEGHFPGKPILPAIVQIAAVRFLAESVLGCSLFPVNLSRVKFKGMVQPDEKIKVRVRLQQEKATWQGELKLVDAQGKTLSSGRIVLAK